MSLSRSCSGISGAGMFYILAMRASPTRPVAGRGRARWWLGSNARCSPTSETARQPVCSRRSAFATSSLRSRAARDRTYRAHSRPVADELAGGSTVPRRCAWPDAVRPLIHGLRAPSRPSLVFAYHPSRRSSIFTSIGAARSFLHYEVTKVVRGRAPHGNPISFSKLPKNKFVRLKFLFWNAVTLQNHN
jgi:hypothetical protein